MTARLTSLIFQQYGNGFKVEFKFTRVAENVQAKARDEVIVLKTINAETTMNGR